MELKISADDLRKNKLFIATPMYGGMANGLYVKSCLDLQGLMSHYGVETRFSFLFNESLITRARNYLVDEFLRSGFTHLLFIDSDIDFNPQDVLALLALDKDIIGAPYPKKSINWRNVAAAVQQNSSVEPGKLEAITGDYVFNPVPGTKQFNVSEPLEVMEIGTGYMLIKKAVFDIFRDKYPHLNYRPDHAGQANFDGSRYNHAYFDTVIDNNYTFQDVHNLMTKAAEGHDVKEDFKKLLELQSNASHRYLSEDYMFCQYWRKIGGKFWLCPWMKTQHVGTYPFRGDMQAIAQLTGKL
jgi:hypothetical protein